MTKTSLLIALSWATIVCGCAGGALAAPTDPYFADIDVRRDARADETSIAGVVFDDANHNGRLDSDEHGVAGVKVSNSREVVLTNKAGRYILPARPDMAVFVIQPSGWRVPTDDRWVPRFAYQHKPAGSPKALRYGGLPPTGPLPSAINFPIIPTHVPTKTGQSFNCAVLGDVQPGSNIEVGYVRDSLVREMLNAPRKPDCLLALGDIVSDDLHLIPRTAEVMGAIGVPQWWVQGNHDYDHDADHDIDSSDTWRRLYGPNNYAFEIGQAVFIVLDNVSFPCGEDPREARERPFCKQYWKTYNGRLLPDQMTFIANVLKATDPSKLVVFAAHIPFVGFDNAESQPHQTDNLGELYALVKGRPALSLTGHSHTLENMAPGDSMGGWKETVGVSTIPFRHLVAGAVAGDWWGGDYDIDGAPMSIQGDGSPRGYVDFAVKGTDYTLDYRASGLPRDRAMWLSVSTPRFRTWAETIFAWRDAPEDRRDAVPPLSIQDLPDVKLLTPSDLQAGSWLTADVWMGDSTTRVMVAIDGGAAAPMARTQEMRGEGVRSGSAYSDPFALQRQLTMARTAIQSRSGDPEAQGYVQGRQKRLPPMPPQPRGSRADHSPHLWRYDLPQGLAEGAHTAVVTVTRDQGEASRDTLVFEVRATRPKPTFDFEHWDRFKNQ
ncbi:calcineurin-like phosphoesterase C-terminal domain-containing protein [uncultured Caulobacter sp.]|uniref:calcineurin-like phosphoesterase C-terminal domain-containing protein n=1 Tax=uncultured Caulobacter sp. TaxID=158749 RepID=UPI002629AD10|nr:calcineurin-like phosphoesterase C-terminal domain-containing protein [uncultured Caulobacter sp.]